MHIFLLFILFSSSSVWAVEKIDSNHEKEVLNRVIPRFKYSGPINEALMQLKEETIRAASGSRALNVIYFPIHEDLDSDGFDDPFSENGEVAPKLIEVKLDLEGLTVLQIIKSICIAHDLRYKVENNIVSVMHPSEETDSFILKLYSVSLSDLKAFQGKGAQLFLESQGVAFNSKARAKYIPSINKLVVSNTKSEQDKVSECLVRFEVNEKLEHLESKIESIKDNAGLLEELNNIKRLLVQNKKDKERPTKKYELEDKLNIIIPKIRMINQNLESFGDFIARTTRDLHKDGESLNIIIRVRPDLYEGKINLNLDDVSVLDLIKFACKQLKLSYKVDEFAVIIGQPAHCCDVTHFYPISAHFLSYVQKEFKGDFKEAIESFGVNFSVGTSISYLSNVQRIVVSNTSKEHEKLKEIFNFFNEGEK
ncbi:MAG: hypothetical protein NE327_06660 [Lentisphaeraceae bacterium]|nr:hypothetical protein [Lentisphaeraceae bacterium]